MEALIGVVVVVVIALTGGTMAFIRRRGKSSYKAGEQKATIDSKLDQLIEHQGEITTKVDKMSAEITRSVTWGKANSEGIQRLTDRFDRHVDHAAGDD